MESILLATLIEKEYFKVETEVDAVRKVLTVGSNMQHTVTDTFTITKMMLTRQTKQLVFEALSVSDGETVIISPSDITAIDGMTPERFAENYMIAPDGTDIPVLGARRGRRPKNWEYDG